MHAFRHPLRRLSWIAFVAIFALAIVPTVSRLLAAGGGNAAWAGICTTQGAKLLASAADGQGSGTAEGAAHLDHCPLCGLSATPFAPPLAATVVAAPSLAEAMPALFSVAPRPLFAWAAARPRGPPAAA